MKTDHAPLIPPHEAPPRTWQERDERFSWVRAALGALVGAVVGLVAFLLDASPWFSLAMPLGFALGGMSKNKDLDIDVPAQWLRK